MSDTMNPDRIFTCIKCGDCCQGYGGTFVTKKDVVRISNHLKIGAERFLNEFCELSGDKPIIAQHKNGHCVFWDKLCTIHSVKPKMCKQWPFIESLLVDSGNWQIMASVCPGIRTDLPGQVVVHIVNKVLSDIG